MLWIGKVKDCFSGDIDIWKIEASNATDALNNFNNMLVYKKPFAYAVCEHWIEPADDQPEDSKTYAVFAYDTKTRLSQTNYPDTLQDARDLARLMLCAYDDVEICYGWSGHFDLIEKVSRKDVKRDDPIYKEGFEAGYDSALESMRKYLAGNLGE